MWVTAMCSRRWPAREGGSGVSSRDTSSSPTWPPPATACSPASSSSTSSCGGADPFSEMAAGAMTQLPQVLVNVVVAQPPARHRRGHGRRDRRRGAAARRSGTGARASERHRTVGAGHGRGRDRRLWPTRWPSAWPPSPPTAAPDRSRLRASARFGRSAPTLAGARSTNVPGQEHYVPTDRRVSNGARSATARELLSSHVRDHRRRPPTV